MFAASKTKQVSSAANYIEDVFSTYLYTGNGSTNTISNNIDLSTKGGLVWLKTRNQANNNFLTDTARGTNSQLVSDSTIAAATLTDIVTAFNTTGFTTGPSSFINSNGESEVSWTFRKQPKFFDIVTYTGNGTNRTIAHSLGSTPGCIIVKSTTQVSNWQVYHSGLTSAAYGIQLNSTNAQASFPTFWNSTAPTDTVFSVGTSSSVNANGETFVAYIFASNAGGFGLTGTDNVISCGSFTTDGSGNASVTLGYEPQFVITKRTDSGGSWWMMDTMRGMPIGGSNQYLLANSSAAEGTGGQAVKPSATGFTVTGTNASANWIYIAIRRGPMKVPTDATKVFKPIFSTTAGAKLTTGFPVDMQFEGYPPGDSLNMSINDRLRGISTNSTQYTSILTTSSTAAESAPNSTMTNFWDNTGFTMPSYYGGLDYISWNFGRAPGFFDEVICTQTGSAQDVTHNLGVAPELLILKDRTSAVSWQVGTQFTSTTWNNLVLNSTAAGSVGAYNNYINAQPTSTVFRLGPNLGSTGDSFVAYLFASCPGVSKVGSYTGNGSTQTINCGFPAGARFVLIKRYDSTGGWYVYDTARGMTTLVDPYLLLNSTAAESATLGSVTTVSTGFAVNASILAAINTNAASYIYLAIA